MDRPRRIWGIGIVLAFTALTFLLQSLASDLDSLYFLMAIATLAVAWLAWKGWRPARIPLVGALLIGGAYLGWVMLFDPSDRDAIGNVGSTIAGLTWIPAALAIQFGRGRAWFERPLS
jgi:hypothetical protein